MTLNKIAAVFTAVILLSSVSVYAQVKKTAVKAKPTSSKGLSANMANGKAIYGKVCITCHMADASGVANMNPPLIKTTYVLGPKPKLLSIVLNGLSETIDVDGDSYSNVMPSQAFLKDQEIADVLTYVRNNFGNKAPAVTLADVKKARAAKK